MFLFLFFFSYRGASLFGPSWHLGYILRIPSSNSIPFTGTSAPPLPSESALSLCLPLEQPLPSLSSYSKNYPLTKFRLLLKALCILASLFYLTSIHLLHLTIFYPYWPPFCSSNLWSSLLFGGLCTCCSLGLECSSAELAPQHSELSSNDTSLQKLSLSKFSSILFCLFTAPIICLYLILFSCLPPLLNC